MEAVVTQFKVVLCWHMPDECERNHGTLQSWQKLCPDRNYNHAPAECKSKALLLELAWSAWLYVKLFSLQKDEVSDIEYYIEENCMTSTGHIVYLEQRNPKNLGCKERVPKLGDKQICIKKFVDKISWTISRSKKKNINSQTTVFPRQIWRNYSQEYFQICHLAIINLYTIWDAESIANTLHESP
jgi:hypothetical protein